MKTEIELNELKEKVKNMKQKLAELTEEELGQVSGGNDFDNLPWRTNGNPNVGIEFIVPSGQRC